MDTNERMRRMGARGLASRWGSQLDRFWGYVDRGADDECWIWRGPTYVGGYGRLSTPGGKHVRAHRFSYELATGTSLAPGLVIRHTCDRPPCVNPAHLLPGTQRENIADMMSRGRHVAPNGLWEACAHGHAFDEQNTWLSKVGKRVCRACKRRYHAEAEERRRAAGLPPRKRIRSRAAPGRGVAK
ncbi:MAG: HNH endonuclease [Chloroflexi bacterium]|nr:HNH endonuclease [Chloroflexota bacterium]